jgi:hypothetical protein
MPNDIVYERKCRVAFGVMYPLATIQMWNTRGDKIALYRIPVTIHFLTFLVWCVFFGVGEEIRNSLFWNTVDKDALTLYKYVCALGDVGLKNP